LSESSTFKAIIIEDSRPKGQVLQSILEQLGFSKVLNFLNAEDALPCLKKSDGDTFLFLDLQLPGISGQELIKIIANDRFKGSVIISSACDPRMIDVALRSAALSGVRIIGALDQPFRSGQIKQLVKSWNEHSPDRYEDTNPDMLNRAEICKAFDEDRVHAFYQPIVNEKKGTIEAIECLARIWDNSKDRHLLPISFLARIIEISFLDNLALRLFQQSLNNFSHPALAASKVKLALNIDPSQLTSETLALSLNELAIKNDIAHTRIIYELTEQSQIDQISQLETINILRLKNYNISIDDFGSGHTNISNLRSIPFNRLKIDRRLIEQVDSDPFCQVAVSSIIALANEVNANVTAEGIETGAQLAALAQHESIDIQGNFICPALSFEERINWIEYSPYKLAQ
jgi:EAL domain-containing protein (putative c-di-GMP-specific phosphodiesterase class I)